MKIGCDVDGVLADFNTAYVARIKEVTGRNLFADPPLMNQWSYAEAAGYTPRELRRVWDNINADEHFWFRLDPYPDIADACDWMRQSKDDIYFITARSGATTKRQTEEWFAYEGFRRATILLSSGKALCCDALRLDSYLDDRFENACDVASNSDTRAFLLTRPWNVQYCTPSGVTRVASLGEFFAEVT